MTNTGLSKFGLKVLDALTDTAPRTVPKLFQRAFLAVFGSETFFRFHQRKYLRIAKEVKQRNDSLKGSSKILFIADVCIGDAVLMGQCLPTLREIFPNAQIHYVCNRTGGELIEGIPGNIIVHNIIEGIHGMPSDADLKRLRTLLNTESYSLILNMSPFITTRTLRMRSSKGVYPQVIPLYAAFATYMLRAWRWNGTREISVLAVQYLRELLMWRKPPGLPAPNASPEACATLKLTNSVYLSRESIEMARAFLQSNNLSPGEGLLFFNPDATSSYGTIPFEVQSQLLRSIAPMPHVRAVLLGTAYTNRAIEQQLILSLPEAFRHKIVLVPHVPIEEYSALIDAADMFISADTGPLHIASCRKFLRSSNGQEPIPLRNRTAIVAIYGATDSRMYGYDSGQPHHIAANQDAPSKHFSGSAPCRNISCINKFGKSCKTVRCFDGLDTDEISDYIDSYFYERTNPLRMKLPVIEQFA
ncbi:MAG TPA: glycosyltransferase family 9 protein [Candidatus Kapabacteria bacterium]|jgi:ADP-heptose:LPS heptosyltransferase|nr:glycosyltransferase family 9 protein [Candidatus Kapabacteria bacterium]